MDIFHSGYKRVKLAAMVDKLSTVVCAVEIILPREIIKYLSCT